MPVRSKPRQRILASLAIGLLWVLLPNPAGAVPPRTLDKATIELKWLHHFQFAGYYAALEKGFYRDVGLDVSIVEGGPNVEVEKDVLSGRADFGVGTSALLLNRARGEDFVVLGQIFQHSPAIFLTPRDTGIRSIADMAGRRFMYSNQHGDMLAILRKNGIDESGIVKVPHKGDPGDLIGGKADVMLAYSFNEPFVLEQVGEPYLTFSPQTYGIDFYGDNFFTTRKLVDKRPEFVAAFREATLRGWRYALAHKAETADLILSKYSRVRSREWLLFEAVQMETLIQPTLVELGYQNPARWRHVSDTFVELGMLPAGFDPLPVIYAPREPKDHRLTIAVVLIAGAIIAVLGGLLFTFRRLNRELYTAHEEMARGGDQLRVLFESSQAGILLVDPAGRVTVVNQRMAELFSCPQEALIGTWYPDLVHPDQRHLGSERMRQMMGREIDRVSTERHFLRKDGTDFWGYISVRRHDDAEGRLVSLVCHITDITELKHGETERLKLERQLLHAQKLESLGVLAGGIAHDFNNILAGILGNVSFARSFIDPSHRSWKILCDAEKAAERAAGLALQLLTFAKGGEPIKKVVEAKRLVRESASLVLSGSGVKCVFDMPDDLRAIEVDEGQVGQVFNNIVLNAAQAMPDGGTIGIRAENWEVAGGADPISMPPGKYVRFRITDQGCGISPEDQKRIFDPYFTTKLSGTGLGLASAWSIVGKHGGRIGVRSVVGSGTTFEIVLPASDLRAVEHEGGTDGSISGVKAGLSLLVMDDEPMIRDLVAGMLQEIGCRVESCANGDEAISCYKSAQDAGKPFDAAILDLTIPGGMGGKEAARRILEFDPGACLVVSSGYSNDSAMAEYTKYGFKAMMAKPYDMSAFGRVLSALFPAVAN